MFKTQREEGGTEERAPPPKSYPGPPTWGVGGGGGAGHQTGVRSRGNSPAACSFWLVSVFWLNHTRHNFEMMIGADGNIWVAGNNLPGHTDAGMHPFWFDTASVTGSLWMGLVTSYNYYSMKVKRLIVLLVFKTMHFVLKWKWKGEFHSSVRWCSHLSEQHCLLIGQHRQETFAWKLLRHTNRDGTGNNTGVGWGGGMHAPMCDYMYGTYVRERGRGISRPSAGWWVWIWVWTLILRFI